MSKRRKELPLDVERWLDLRAAEKERKEKKEAAKPKVVPVVVIQPRFKFNLGEYVKDRVTGKSGYIVVRNEHLSGCLQYWVTDKGDGGAVTTDRIHDECCLDRTATPPLEMPEHEDSGCVLLA